jgi:hypothetical protein
MATRYVRYVGAAHRRVITAADWRSVGVKGDQVIWEAQNGFAVPLDQFNDAQIKKAIERDSGFTITAEDDEFEPHHSPVDMTPRELQQSVENPVDLVAILNGDAPAPAGISGPSTGLLNPADAAPNGNTGPDEDEVDPDQDHDTRTNQDRLA